MTKKLSDIKLNRERRIELKKHPKLRGRIVEKFGSITEFSKTIGKTRTNTSQKLNDKTGFSKEDMKEWGELLDIPFEEYGIFFLD